MNRPSDILPGPAVVSATSTVPDTQASIIDDGSPPTTGEAEEPISSAEDPLSDPANRSGELDAPVAESIEAPEEQASVSPPAVAEKEDEPAAELTEGRNTVYFDILDMC